MELFAVITGDGTENMKVHALFADNTEACFYADDLPDETAHVYRAQIELVGPLVDYEAELEAWQASLKTAAKREP